MKNRVFIILFLFFHNTFVGFTVSNTGQKRILLINSYHQGLSWTDSITSNIARTLKSDSIILDIEYLDGKRTLLTNFYQTYLQFFHQKYSLYKPHIIIASDNLALDFSIALRKRLNQAIPIVFCGINNFSDTLIHKEPNITGLVEISSPLETVMAALSLHPNTKTVYVICDNTETGIAEQIHAKNQLKLIENTQFQWLVNISEAELLEAIKKIDTESLILLILFNRDVNNQYFSYEEIAQKIAEVAPCPIYGLWDFYLGHGVLGGHLINGATQGKITARLALDILRRGSADGIPVVREESNRWIFDYKQLTRWKINEKHLPPGSIVVNKPLSWLEEHRKIVITVLLIMLTEALVIGLLLLLFLQNRRKSMRQISQSEALYRMIYKFAPIGMFHFQSDGKIILYNENFRKIIPTTDNNLNLEVLFPGSTYQLISSANEIEREIIDPEMQHHKTVRMVAKPIDADNHLFIGLLEDITEQRLAQKKLLESEQRHRAIFNNNHTPILLINPETKSIHSANSAACSLYGWDIEEVQQKKITEIFSVDMEQAELFVDRILNEKKNYFLIRSRRSPEKIRHLEFYTGKIIIDRKTMIYVMIHDVTQRIEAETKNLRHTARLKAFEQIFNNYDRPLEELWTLALQKALELTKSNRGFIALFSPEQRSFNLISYLGYDNLFQTNIFDHYYRPTLESLFKDETKPVIANNHHGLFLISRSFPTELINLHRLIFHPIVAASQLLGVVCVENKNEDYTTDDLQQISLLFEVVWSITRRKEAEITLAMKNKELEETLRLRDTLLSIISHDIRNPLTTILGMTELLQRRFKSQEAGKTEHMLSIIRDTTVDVVTLFENLLEWTKIQTKNKILQIQELELYPLLSHIVEQQNKFSNLKGINIELNTFDCRIKADEKALSMIIRNLLSNAIKFSHSNSTVRVEVKETDNNTVLISVTDYGIGISEENQKKLFHSVYEATQQGTSGEKGSGIGLTLCYNFAKMMGGEMTVKSSENQGSTFTLILPSVKKIWYRKPF